MKGDIMANRNQRLPYNTAGRYYVDDSCIDCDQCRSSSPTLFARESESGMSYVQRQPMSAEELTEAEEALNNCPSGSIGNDAIEPLTEG